ncbi:MAG: thioesterase family protein [Acidimicrobiales bacterium]
MPRIRPETHVPSGAGPVAGQCARASLDVTDADTASSIGTGDVPVLATARLVALCEEASCRALADRLGARRTSVASRVQFDHLLPVPAGTTVTAEATLERVEGRRLIFTVSVGLHSALRTGLVGAGRLTRVLVDRDAFLCKAGAPAQSVAGSSARRSGR